MLSTPKPRVAVKGARVVKQTKPGAPKSLVQGGAGVSKIRRPFQAVDTNVAAYDRTDPFAAVNALRKLLAVLPSRTGGNQLKLSQDEHKLAMHLLSIVEPVSASGPL